MVEAVVISIIVFAGPLSISSIRTTLGYVAKYVTPIALDIGEVPHIIMNIRDGFFNFPLKGFPFPFPFPFFTLDAKVVGSPSSCL